MKLNLKDMNKFSRMNEIYMRGLQDTPPTRTAVEVTLIWGCDG
jgi:enamine deaminase RidA (YjgF/YER057c/UK114 family)